MMMMKLDVQFVLEVVVVRCCLLEENADESDKIYGIFFISISALHFKAVHNIPNICPLLVVRCRIYTLLNYQYRIYIPKREILRCIER